jgi:hypothetical protein
VLPFSRKVLPEGEDLSRKTHFAAADVALVSVFCGLWAILSLTLGRLSFALLGLPVLHDFAAFFTLLLVAWATGRFGTASLVGIVGSVVVLMVGGPLPNAGFAASAVVFDILMTTIHHKLNTKARNVAAATLVCAVSAYFAGVVIGVFLMNKPLDGGTLYAALTFWGGWHLVGGIASAAITLPIIGILERANVRRIQR